ncbi:MAG: threonine ammonia-lyase [Synergistetes bacterium]|nr:threonine ammonia-lyase [Synergistota bacterium]MCX8128065.1 threonine ammonia-lyase [Synergistota bacterium]
MISLKKIEEARKRIAPFIHKTPIESSKTLSKLSNCDVFLKLETFQKTGSYKVRGALNKILNLKENRMIKGVIAASAGNHAQGVAYSASQVGVYSLIVMPETAPMSKIAATRNYGAEVILHGEDFDSAYKKAKELAEEKNLYFIHAFDDPEVIAGQGTIALEILEDLKDVQAVIVPVGGGGLIAGVSTAIKEINPKIKVIGVQAEGAPAVYLSIREGKIIELEKVNTIADGIAVRRPGEITTQIIKKYVDEIILVSDEEIASAILLLIERGKLIVEAAGAVGVAAIIARKISLKGEKVLVILSGGNIDVNMIARLIERGLIKTGRLLRFSTTLPDRPGALVRILKIIAEERGNIVSINHDRINLKIKPAEAEVTITVETYGKDHIEKILKSLEYHKYRIKLD